jgi:hypothetical protein
MRDTRKTRTYRVLIGGKMPVERLKPRWEDNIKTDLTETAGFLWVLIRTSGWLM